MTLYVRFRGREPSVEPLLERRGSETRVVALPSTRTRVFPSPPVGGRGLG